MANPPKTDAITAKQCPTPLLTAPKNWNQIPNKHPENLLNPKLTPHMPKQPLLHAKPIHPPSFTHPQF